MGYLAVAVAAFVLGAVLMGILTSNERIEESMERFNAGYEKGLEDGKRMKGEAKNENDESTGSRR